MQRSFLSFSKAKLSEIQTDVTNYVIASPVSSSLLSKCSDFLKWIVHVMVVIQQLF